MKEEDYQLRSFLAIARAGSLRAAAEKLQISQPALSKQLQRLERAIDAPLFRRHGRGMALTEVGQELFIQLDQSFALVDLAVERARDAHARGRSFITIATVNTLATYVVPDLLRLLLASRPLLRVSVLTASSPDVVERVERGYADIGLVYDISVNTSAVLVRRLHSETLAGYCTPTHPHSHDLSAEDLAKCRLILPPRPYALRGIVERELSGDIQVAIESNSVSMSLDLAAQGLGLAILPWELPESSITTRGLIRVRLLGASMKRPVAAIYRSSTRVNETILETLTTIETLTSAF